MSIFRKCHIKLCLIIQVGHPFRLWLHFYSVFEFSPKSVVHYFRLSWARLEKCIFQPAENFKEQRFHFFDILRILEPDFQNIHIPGPRKSVLGPGDVFGAFWGVRKSSIYLQFCKFYINSGRCSTKVVPMNLSVNMALALFFKLF